MKILMVYPQYPGTFWSFKHALKFISKKAAVPPLGLITVSAMLPEKWEKKLVDLNVATLNIEDLLWADYVFTSAMYVQKESVDTLLKLCKLHKKKVVAGGPLFTQEYNNYPEIDHFVLGEAEITLKPFLEDLKKGVPKKVYSTTEFADITATPVPDYYLLDMSVYAFMNMQFTRGCPFACDFCEITTLLGRKIRMKTTTQILNEMQTLYDLNWRGSVSIVDDNFIGQKKNVKDELLPAMYQWMQQHNFPFAFSTQTSINMADDDELLLKMKQTGFASTFIGIETPDEECLKECKKSQNMNRNLLHSVKKIQRAGIMVSGGFIVGFDSDTPSVFERQINFIQKSGIVNAMVGLLNAPKNTVLYKRLESENRLTVEATGNNTDASMNFIPKMNKEDLIGGYEKIIRNIYATKPFYDRAKQFLINYKNNKIVRQKITFTYLKAAIKSFVIIGMLKKGRRQYWQFLLWTLFNRPALIVEAITFTVYGYHFRTVYGVKQIKGTR